MFAQLYRAVQRRVLAHRALRRARISNATRLDGAPVNRVLVVCYGNIYRSPFVAFALKRALPDVQVRSSGFHKAVARPSPPRHVQMSSELGIDLSAHRSTLITAADLQWADTILLMDRHNWTRLQEMGADPGKCVWLGALVPGPVEVRDPYDLDESQALDVLQQMRAATQEFAACVRARRA